MPGSFVVFQKKEKVCKAKPVQIASGVHPSAYWTSTFLWDLTVFFALTVLLMLILLFYRAADNVYVGDLESLFCTWLLAIGYGTSVLPFSYLIA